MLVLNAGAPRKGCLARNRASRLVAGHRNRLLRTTALAACLMLVANTSALNAKDFYEVSGGDQTFDNPDVLRAERPNTVNGGRQTFLGSALNASAPNAVSGGTQTFSASKLNASAPRAVNGGTQIFQRGSSLNASVPNAVGGGTQIFLAESKLNASQSNAVNGGIQEFYANSALDAKNAFAISGGVQNFYDTSILTAGTADAVSGGAQTFFGTSILQATADNAVSGGTQIFRNASVLESDKSNAVSGGAQSFYNASILNARAPNAVSGGALAFHNTSILNVLSDEALGSNVQVSFDNRGGAGPGGTLVLNGFNTSVGSITSLASGSGRIVNGDAREATLTVDSSQRGDSIFSGIIAAGGGALHLIKIGAGTFTLSGANTYTGETSVDGGTLVVNGSIERSPVLVNIGGTLSGNGKFGRVENRGGTVTGSGRYDELNNNGGTISPGNSIGTVHITGNLSMGPNAEYYVEINGTKSDLIQVAGTAHILSSTFRIGHDTDRTSAPVLPGKTYTILTTGGGLTGSTPSVGIADFPFLNFALRNDGFNAYLTTSRGSGAFAELATTPNQKAVANALDAAGAASPLWQQVVGASEAQARAAFTSLGSAAIHASAAGVLSAQSHDLRDAVTDRVRQDFAPGTALAPGGSVMSFASGTPREASAADTASSFHKAPLPMLAAAPAFAMWAQGLGSWGSLKGDRNAASTGHSQGGVISGLDVTFNGRWRVGLAGGYTRSRFDTPGLAASGSSDSYHVALYGGGQIGAWGLRAGASYSWNELTTSRQVAVVNLGGLERGDYSPKTTQLFGEAGHSFAFAGGALEPFANVAYVRIDGDVSERGVAATTGSMQLDTIYTTLGLRGTMALTDTLTARGTLAWRHAFGDVTPLAALAFQSGGAGFALAGSPIARDALVAAAGFDLAIAANASLGVAWTGQFANGSHDNTLKGNLRWSF
jgi:outer membrane autotransporter protein